MTQDPYDLVTRSELWLRWAADHGVRYDDTGKSFDEVARDYYQTSDSYRELLVPDLDDAALTASHQQATNVAYARLLLIEAVIGRRGGDLALYVDPLDVIDPNGQVVPRHPRPGSTAGWETAAAPPAAPEPLPQSHDAATRRGYGP